MPLLHYLMQQKCIIKEKNQLKVLHEVTDWNACFFLHRTTALTWNINEHIIYYKGKIKIGFKEKRSFIFFNP